MLVPDVLGLRAKLVSFGVGGGELVVVLLELRAELVPFGEGGLELILVLLELRAELVPLTEGRATLVLVLLELRGELVPFGVGFLQLALKLLGLDACGLNFVFALGHDRAELSPAGQLGLKPPDLLTERFGLNAERFALLLESPGLRGSQAAEGVPQRLELAAQDVQVLPLLIQLRREPLPLAACLLRLREELVVLRSKAGEFLLPAGQLGASLVPLGADGRELAGEVGRLSLLPAGLLGRSRDFRLRVELVEEIPSGSRGGRAWALDDVLDQEFVAAGAANVMTGQFPPDAQRHRTRRANHGDAIGVLLADVRPICRKPLGGGRRHQVRGEMRNLCSQCLH